jgi:hypothetical protein
MSVRDLLLPAFHRVDEGGGAGSGSVDVGRLEISGHAAIGALFDFTVAGGTCGRVEADAVERAVDAAIESGVPLVSVIASGGTRLTEGMRALVGIPRIALALQRLRAVRLVHLSVADHPTTGGVWVALGAAADLRVGVTGATVAFSGPRVVEALTGRSLAAGSGTAESAHSRGLLDAVVPEGEVPEWLARALGVDGLDLAGADGTVAARLHRLDGEPVVEVLLAAEAGALVSADGFALLARAAGIADTLDAALLIRVDTLGGDPHDEGVPASLLQAMQAVLDCRSPTVCLLSGAGGSGGALAGAVTDRVLVGPDGWFAALAPSGAAAALRRGLDEVVDVLRPAPAQLLADGFADDLVEHGEESQAVITAIRELRRGGEDRRLEDRQRRWTSALPDLG